jgi:hypothetical protein
MALANTDEQSGYIMVTWGKEFTIWNYDGRLYERMTQFDTKCWPVKITARHLCRIPWIVTKIAKPYLYALMDKESRSRMLYHDIPENELLGALSDFGIPMDVLPTDMGGTVRLNQDEWIANRRAAELKEI